MTDLGKKTVTSVAQLIQIHVRFFCKAQASPIKTHRLTYGRILEDLCREVATYEANHFSECSFFLSQPMPEAATDIEFLDATVGMNIPKNFIPAIEKVLIYRHFFSSNQAFK